ncbi:unnamed protein product [Plutella xylostella]|uniref:(diamondback moth) hypothetical protein n=1 Tax=Plutella xylostella TaxID=51655 RepID=A0A8S4F434_PLUXY|nr:adenylate kinase isoenzyme 1 [Plutella xylostella]CAG9121624.1 unnamed protein product [Plutella xylostella]
MEDNICTSCGTFIPDKDIGCPLKCRDPRCSAYNKPPLIDISRTHIICLLGAPQSGKSLQCDKLVARYGYCLLTAEEVLYAEVKEGGQSKRARCVADVIQRGDRVPDQIVVNLIKEAIIRESPTTNGFIIKGYPKDKKQALIFERTIAPICAFIYLESLPDILAARLRQTYYFDPELTEEQKEEVIMRKLAKFTWDVNMLMREYPKKARRINTNKPINEVFDDITYFLDPIAMPGGK